MQAPVRYPPAWPGASLGNCRPTRRASPGQTRMGRLPPRLAKGCQSTPKRARSIAARSSGPSLTFAVSINRISSSTSARSTGSFRLTSSGSRAGHGRARGASLPPPARHRSANRGEPPERATSRARAPSRLSPSHANGGDAGTARRARGPSALMPLNHAAEGGRLTRVVGPALGQTRRSRRARAIMRASA